MLYFVKAEEVGRGYILSARWYLHELRFVGKYIATSYFLV